MVCINEIRCHIYTPICTVLKSMLVLLLLLLLSQLSSSSSLPFPLSTRSPSIRYNIKCDSKKTEKKSVCRLLLLPFAVAAAAAVVGGDAVSASVAVLQPAQPAKELSIDSFKWCGIVVWLGDSHSVFFFHSFIRSFSVAFFSTLIFIFFLLNFANAFILDVDCLQFTAFASNLLRLGKVCTCGCWAINLLLLLLFAGFCCDGVFLCVFVWTCARARANIIHWIP